jgi:hypothetical protein
MCQTRQLNSVTIELTSEDVLFLLSCIETSDRQNLKILVNERLYVRLVNIYVNIVNDYIDPTRQMHNLANEVIQTCKKL